MTEKFKIACIGAGTFARSVHMPVLNARNDVQIVGVCDLNPETATIASQEFNIPKIYNDHQQMLEQLECDAVYVILPPHVLFDPVMDCLEAKRHVFIEKPPALTTVQTIAMAKAASLNGCITMAGFQRRHIPLLQFLRQKVEEKGEITQFTVCYYKNLIDSSPYYRGAIGMLRCDMIHAVDMMRHLGGEVIELANYNRCIGTDYVNSCNAIARFDSGRVGVMQTTWGAGRRFFTIEIHGHGISVFVDPDSHGILYSHDYPDGKRYTPAEIAGSDEYLNKVGFARETDHFLESIRIGRQPVTCFADAVKTMQLVDRLEENQGD